MLFRSKGSVLKGVAAVQSKLEKQLAAMSGRKKTKTTSEPSDVGVAPEPARTSKSVSTEPKAEPKSAPKSTSTAKTPNVSYKISSNKNTNKTSWHDLRHHHQTVFIDICNFIQENIIYKARCYFLLYFHRNYIQINFTVIFTKS